MQPVKEIIIEILTITEYEGNKEDFAHRLVDLFHRQAIIDVIVQLPADEQETIKKKLSENVTPEMEKTFLLQHITPDKYLSALKKASELIFIDYIETTLAALTEEKKKKLTEYLNSLNPS